MNKNREMRTIAFIGILAFFLGTIIFISCNNDKDNAGYYLELSANSCEVMQLRTTSISLVAHENTALEIIHPELVDAVYNY